MKLLYILNTAPRVGSFSRAARLAAQGLGWEFHIAGSWGYADAGALHADEERYQIRIHSIPFERNPLHPGNLIALSRLLALLDREHFDLIHCSTPAGGVWGRLAAWSRGLPVLYQAHGFHFYQGAPFGSGLPFRLAERLLALGTDGLITINGEDFAAARKFRLRKGGRVYLVHGVGTETDPPGPQPDKTLLRRELGLDPEAVVLLSAGELNRNKNHRVLVQALALLRDPGVHLVLCGEGPEREPLRRLAESLSVGGQVHLPGYREDLPRLLPGADLFLLSSRREGLPRSLMEAMALGLPCAASDIRGNRDLLLPGENGFLCDPDRPEDFAQAIRRLLEQPSLRCAMGERNRERVRAWALPVVTEELTEIYREMTERRKGP